MRLRNIALFLGAQSALAAPQVGKHRQPRHCGSTTVTSTVTPPALAADFDTKTPAQAVETPLASGSILVEPTSVRNISSLSTPLSDPPAQQKSSSGSYRNILYFTNWGTYRSTFPEDMPVETLTHVLYSFANISSTGEVISSDPWSDYGMPMSGETIDWSSPQKRAYGSVNQLFQIKKKNRNLKVLLSIGGWTYSSQFVIPSSTEEGRTKFAGSAVKLMADWGFDGLDIDWEYPTDEIQGQNFVLLLKACRKALDDYAARNKQTYHYELTVAASAGASHYKLQNLRAMDQYLDAWHLMTYDFAGVWSKATGHQANLYRDKKIPQATEFDSDTAIRDYINSGVRPSKIVFGFPLYGRSFADSQGLGMPFKGAGRGTVEAGIVNYKDLPVPESKSTFDAKTGATWSMNPSTKEFISFDGPKSANFKAKYIKDQALGGAFFWEASQDKKGAESLVRIVAKNFQGKVLQKQNMLSYPESQFSNIKSG